MIASRGDGGERKPAGDCDRHRTRRGPCAVAELAFYPPTIAGARFRDPAGVKRASRQCVERECARYQRRHEPLQSVSGAEIPEAIGAPAIRGAVSRYTTEVT